MRFDHCSVLTAFDLFHIHIHLLSFCWIPHRHKQIKQTEPNEKCLAITLEVRRFRYYDLNDRWFEILICHNFEVEQNKKNKSFVY